jgi:hypothetical protein
MRSTEAFCMFIEWNRNQAARVPYDAVAPTTLCSLPEVR